MRSPVTFAACALVSAAFCQQLHVTPTAAVVYGSPGDPSLIEGDIIVWNDTSASLDVWCTRVELSVVPGSGNAFAWSNMLPPGAATDPIPLSIAALGYADVHQGWYFPNGTVGSTVIQYCFYTLPSMADSLCATITFTTGPAGVDWNEAPPALFGYDATTGMLFASAGLSGDLLLTIMDAAGRQVAGFTLHPGERASCSQLQPGSYMAMSTGADRRVVHFAR